MPGKRKNPFNKQPHRKRFRKWVPPASSSDELPTVTSATLADPSSLPQRAIEAVHTAVVKEVRKGQKNVYRGLKKARGFEKQKLIKRIKVARESKDNSLLKKFEVELDMVKEMVAQETETLAEVHTLRSLMKKRGVATSLLWPKELVARKDTIEEEMGKTLDREREKARANVISRLYRSNPTKEATSEVVQTVTKIMGLSEEHGESAKKVQRGAAEVEEQGEQQEESEQEEQNAGSDHPTELSDGDRIVEESEEFQGFSDPVEPSPEDEQGSGSDGTSNDDNNDIDPWERLMDPNSDDFAELEERIRASDDAEDTDEDETRHNELERTDDEWSCSEADDEKDEEEEEVDGVEESKLAEPGSKNIGKQSAPTDKEKLSKKRAPNEKKSASSASSQFLPTLMSGYVSGGDSDPDVECYKKKGPPEKAVRKNRMGQQARRALWEKKFGREANHVKKNAEKIKEKREGKTAKGARGGRGGARGGRDGAVARGEGRDDRPPGRPQEKKDEGPLHPSWEAARKAKERQAQMQAAMFKPQGKKITFD